MSVQTVRIIALLIQKRAPDTSDAGALRASFRRIVQAAHAVLAPEICAILGINPITEEFILPLEFAGELRRADQDIPEPPRADGITQEILRQRIVFIQDIAAHPHFHTRFMESEGIRAFAAMALFSWPRRNTLSILHLDYP